MTIFSDAQRNTLLRDSSPERKPEPRWGEQRTLLNKARCDYAKGSRPVDSRNPEPTQLDHLGGISLNGLRQRLFFKLIPGSEFGTSISGSDPAPGHLGSIDPVQKQLKIVMTLRTFVLAV